MENRNLKKFQHDDWVQIWEGGWSFLSCSHFGDEYTKEILFGKNPFMSQVIIFSRNGRSTAWITQSDRDLLGRYLAKQVQKNPALGKAISKDLESQVDSIMPFIKKHITGNISLPIYKGLWGRIKDYYRPHINVKYVVDYLDSKLLVKLLPDFEHARVHAEQVFGITEKFVYNFAKQVAKETKYPYKLILSLTKEELYKYFKGAKLPAKNILLQRYKSSALVFDKKSFGVYTGSDIKKIENLIFSKATTEKLLKGVPAFPGKITGIAKVINDPKNGHLLKKGEILVSGMTRPEFLPIMKRASAFVTDSGGILCHAAIVAREMKKPCVTGTKIATKFFKDGDIIEVDATKGVVRRLT